MTTISYPDPLSVEEVRRQLEYLSDNHNNSRTFTMWTNAEGVRQFDTAMYNYMRETGITINNPNVTFIMTPEESFLKRFLSIEDIEDLENNETIANL